MGTSPGSTRQSETRFSSCQKTPGSSKPDSLTNQPQKKDEQARAINIIILFPPGVVNYFSIAAITNSSAHPRAQHPPLSPWHCLRHPTLCLNSAINHVSRWPDSLRDWFQPRHSRSRPRLRIRTVCQLQKLGAPSIDRRSPPRPRCSMTSCLRPPASLPPRSRLDRVLESSSSPKSRSYFSSPSTCISAFHLLRSSGRTAVPAASRDYTRQPWRHARVSTHPMRPKYLLVKSFCHATC